MRLRTTIAVVALLAIGALCGWLAASAHMANVFAQDKRPADGTPKPPTDFKCVIKF
jgi:hypothetical protein